MNETYMKSGIMIGLGENRNNKPRECIIIMDEESVKSENWIEAGIICSTKEMKKVFADVVHIYGDAGFQLKIDTANEPDCRKVFHRILTSPL